MEGNLIIAVTVIETFCVCNGSWAEEDGSINESANQRPGKVLYYVLHKLKKYGKYKDHILAIVHWFSEHNCHSLYGKPLEIWSTKAILEGPSMFLPVEKVIGRCGVCPGRIPCPSGTDEQVLFFYFAKFKIFLTTGPFCFSFAPLPNLV